MSDEPEAPAEAPEEGGDEPSEEDADDDESAEDADPTGPRYEGDTNTYPDPENVPRSP